MVGFAREVRDARNGAIILAQRLVELDAGPDTLRAELGRADEADLPLPAVLELDDLSYCKVRHGGRKDIESVRQWWFPLEAERVILLGAARAKRKQRQSKEGCQSFVIW